MSLIHWWPLNGNLNDYGINNNALTNNGATIDNAGKIGKCYSFNSNTLTLSSVNIGDEFSVSYWVYYTDLAYPKTHVGIQHSAGAYTGTNKGWDIGHGPSGGGTYNFDINDGANIQRMSFSTANLTQLNVWKHFTLTCSLAARKVSLYINGAFIETKTINSNINSFKIDRALTIGSLYGWSLKGKLNDFRLYDHALSKKEVKEISKGLVLHYNFEDGEIESTTNLISTVNSSNAKLPKAENGVDLQTASGDAYCSLALSTALVNGNTYTLSFDVSNLSNTEYISFGFYDSGMHNTTTINKNGKATITFTAWNTASSLTFDDGSRNNTTVVLLRNFQLEAKDHATPYVNGTRSAGKVYDNSGYGYNGTVNGDLPIYNDSSCGVGKHCIKYDATYTHNINTGMNPSFLSSGLTLIMWVKNNKDFLLANGQSTSYYLMAMDSSSKWSGGTSGTATYYMDGAVNTSGRATDNKWHMYAITLTGGIPNWTSLYFNRHTDSWSINGNVADIKLYATVLSATDILNEYKRKAAIDKNGNLFTGEIVETASITSPKIDKNNFVSASTISEGLMTKALSDGSVFERIYFFDYDKAGSVWTTATAKSCNTVGKFSVLGSLISYIPSDGWYEFYYRENNNWVRWKQSYNPLSRVKSGTSGTSSEYTYIGGSASPYSSFSGLTRYSNNDDNSCYLRGAPSWWCAIAPYQTSYDVFPDMWGNSTGNHHQELWIRIDNLKAAPEFNDNDVKLNSTGIVTGQIIEN